MRKVCPHCQKIYAVIPPQAKHFIDPDVGGYYWECDCGTTLYVPEGEVEKNDARAS